MRCPLFAFLLLLLCTCVRAQSRVDFGRVDDDVLSERLTIDDKALTDWVYNDIPKEYRDQLTDRSAFRFADQASRSTYGILTGGQIYNGWTEMDDYVNGVLNKVMPDELRGKEYVRAYVIKDGSPNAFMLPSGVFCINIGMIAEIESESNLAGIIGHELAHYELRHGLERYVKAESGDFDNSLFFNQRKAMSSFSVENELDSDAKAAQHLARAGYELEGLAETFTVFKRQEDRALLQMEDVWKLKETTHPSSGRRIERIRDMIGETEGEANTAALTAESEATFQKLRQQARAEVLKYLLAGFNYQTCLEKAFRFHLFEPNNPTYVYYAMEAIRRSCYLDVTMWNKKFLAHNYHDIIEVRGAKKKRLIEGNFFDEFRPAILTLDSNSYKSIPAKFYWESPKFTTYEEAYAFFYRVGKALKEPECVFSNALSLSFDEEKRNQFLTEYLAYGDVPHKAFAEALLNDKIYETLTKRKLTVFNKLIPVIKHADDNIVVWHSGNDKPLREAVKKSIAAYDDRDFLYLPDLAKTNINDYLLFNDLENFSFRTLHARGDKTQLHILDPGYWDVMKRYGTNRIEFVNCVYNDKAKGDYNLEVYQEVVNNTFDDILRRPEEKGRYVQMFVSGFQISEDGPMKLRFYDVPDKLANNGDGYSQITGLLTKKLAELDETVEED
jgi:hypothetical protein